jgi:putative selenate reductase
VNCWRITISDKLIPVSIERLARWLFDEGQPEYRLGIPRELFFHPQAGDVFGMERYGQWLETPLGVAAGPHTQLAQNIIAAWMMGARYIELKTVQTLDDIPVTKPCIDMGDEGYNCEWSQELSLDESFGEYLNAWILIHLLRNSPDWSGRSKGDGFIFNLSVGYNLEGILQPNVQRFLDRMADCRTEKEARLEALIPHYPVLGDLEIPDRISDNITLSTMHGCPPEEIEKIARYFIEERGLHTTIKLNPTLLGPGQVREILNVHCGFPVEVPDAAFDHDLKFDDALALIKALQQSALDHQVQFGLKLTNTLETRNVSGRLPDTEDMLYMSGRALNPISTVSILPKPLRATCVLLPYAPTCSSPGDTPVSSSTLRSWNARSGLLEQRILTDISSRPPVWMRTWVGPVGVTWAVMPTP